MLERLPIRQSLPIAAALLLAAAPALEAQGQTLLQWSGSVDREIQIAMRGTSVWRHAGENVRGASRVTVALPRTSGSVRVRVLEGRGNVDVVQQPSPNNGYTAIVRIRDPRSGSDHYRIATYWQRDFGTVVGQAGGPRIESRERGGYGDWERGGNGDWDRRGNDDSDRGGWERGDSGRENDRYGYGRTRGTMHWAGTVDDNLEIRVRRRDIDYRTLRGKRPRDIRVDVSGASINRGVSSVELRNVHGRGSVYVVQRPSARNDYTLILRVRDPRGGYGRYDFDVVWR